MAMNETMGEPIPRGIIGDSAAIADDSYGSNPRSKDQAAQLAEIKEELRQLSRTITQLAENGSKFAQDRIQTAAQTAVDRYPVGSLALAALVGYWFGSRRH